MSSTEKILEATLNRLAARFQEKFLKKAIEVSEGLKSAPEKIQKEWDIFQEEVISEAERLEKESDKSVKTSDIENKNNSAQENITKIKSKVSKLSRQIEEIN